METFSALLALCAGNSQFNGEFSTQRPATRSLDVFFDLRPNKQLSKHAWGWLFETPSLSLWRHCNAVVCLQTPQHLRRHSAYWKVRHAFIKVYLAMNDPKYHYGFMRSFKMADRLSKNPCALRVLNPWNTSAHSKHAEFVHVYIYIAHAMHNHVLLLFG